MPQKTNKSFCLFQILFVTLLIQVFGLLNVKGGILKFAYQDIPKSYVEDYGEVPRILFDLHQDGSYRYGFQLSDQKKEEIRRSDGEVCCLDAFLIDWMVCWRLTQIIFALSKSFQDRGFYKLTWPHLFRKVAHFDGLFYFLFFHSTAFYVSLFFTFFTQHFYFHRSRLRCLPRSMRNRKQIINNMRKIN